MKYHHPVINDTITLRNSNNFYIVTFNYPLYFPKTEMVFLIIFAYVPFMISFNCLFQSSSNKIYNRIINI